MEILSFVLGMSLVVVIAAAVVAVIGFFKARKIEEETNRIHTIMGNESERVTRDIADIYQCIAEENRQIHQKVDLFEKDIYSQLDSRLDKLETKLTNNKK